MVVRLIDGIDSEKNQVGRHFSRHAKHRSFAGGNRTLFRQAPDITGHIVELKSAGKFAGNRGGAATDSIKTTARATVCKLISIEKEGKSRGKNTAEKVGGRSDHLAALSARLRAAARGSHRQRGGCGRRRWCTGASKSQQIKLPSETVLNFNVAGSPDRSQATGFKMPGVRRLGDSQ